MADSKKACVRKDRPFEEKWDEQTKLNKHM